jgi:hypothetical protein
MKMFSTLKMEDKLSSETLVDLYKTVRLPVLEDNSLHHP